MTRTHSVSRRVVKTAWRIATQHRGIFEVDELMQRSQRIANLVYLDKRQHRTACELVIQHGEDYLARWLTELDTQGPFDTD